MSQFLLGQLGIVCPNCDEYVPAGTLKCPSCGADPLGATPAAKVPSKPAGAAPRTLGQPPPPAVTPLPVAPAVAPVTQTPAPRGGPAPAPQGRPSGLKEPPGLNVRAGVRQVDVAPPGMRPTARTPAGPLALDTVTPVPASDLLKKPAQAPPSRFSLLVVAGAQKGQRFRLPVTATTIGKARGTLLFPDDVFVSPTHATVTVRDGLLYVKDESSASGTFVSIPGQEQIQANGHFAAGQRLFRFMGLLNAAQTRGPPGAAIVYGAPLPPGHVVYGVEEILIGGRGGRAVVTGGALLTIGQAKCDLSFPAEEGMAGRHCELSPTPAGALLRDLSGGLGTFVRLTAERQLNPGDRVRIGQQILQVET